MALLDGTATLAERANSASGNSWNTTNKRARQGAYNTPPVSSFTTANAWEGQMYFNTLTFPNPMAIDDISLLITFTSSGAGTSVTKDLFLYKVNQEGTTSATSVTKGTAGNLCQITVAAGAYGNTIEFYYKNKLSANTAQQLTTAQFVALKSWFETDRRRVLGTFSPNSHNVANTTADLSVYSSSGGYSRHYLGISAARLRLTVNPTDNYLWYNNNGTWVRTIPWYNNGGTWAKCKPWYNNGGTWVKGT